MSQQWIRLYFLLSRLVFLITLTFWLPSSIASSACISCLECLMHQRSSSRYFFLRLKSNGFNVSLLRVLHIWPIPACRTVIRSARLHCSYGVHKYSHHCAYWSQSMALGVLSLLWTWSDRIGESSVIVTRYRCLMCQYLPCWLWMARCQ